MQARLEREKKRLYPAIESYRKALNLAPERDRPGLRTELVGALIESRNLAEARIELDRLLAQAPVPDGVLLHHAVLLRLENRPQDALAAVNRVLERQPDAPAASMLRGEIKLDLGDYGGAVKDLEDAVRRMPFNKECHYKVAMAHRALGNRRQAETHAKRSRELADLSLQALDIEQQVSLEPNNAALRLKLATIYEQLGNPQRAEFWRSGARAPR
jgi:predicted Zn-dependent protease